MVILILTNKYSGLYSFRKEVVKAIRDLGHEVVISVPFEGKNTYFEDIGCKLYNTTFNRKGINPIKDLGLMFFYIKLIKLIRPDVVLSYTIKPNLYGGMACQLCRIPQIANVTGLGSAVENSGWLQKITILLYKIGLRRARTIFFQNKGNYSFCQKRNMVKNNGKLIPGSGVNLLHFTFQPYPLQEEPMRFVFISRLMREKGIEEYLAAARVIKNRFPLSEFHILGSCEENYADRIEKMQNDGIIIYHGRQSDVRPFYSMCHCTVHPSFYPEGLSNVLLESCATGRPIITTNRPGCGEIVENDVNGFVVKERDVDDLVCKIEKFMALPYGQKQEMGMAARRKVEKEFDRKIVVDAYLKELSQIENSNKL